MNKIIKYVLLAVIVMAACVSCQINIYNGSGSGGNGSTTINMTDLYGTWVIEKAKYSPEGQATAWPHEQTYATFNNDGSYESVGFWGNVKGNYTVSGTTIEVNADGVRYATYQVLSIENEKASFLAIFQNATVWLECKKEEILEEQTPEAVLSEDVIFQSESNVRMYIYGLYSQTVTYIRQQLDVEKQIIYNDRTQINPDSKAIRDLWSAGYTLINRANAFLKAASPDKYPAYDQYRAHARTLRNFVLYNMSAIWGGVPIITENMSLEDALEVARASEKGVYEYIVNDISQYGGITDDNWMNSNAMFSPATYLAFLLELTLYGGDTDKAAKLADDLSYMTGNLQLTFEYHPDTTLSTGYMIIYSTDKAYRYIYEAIFLEQTETCCWQWYNDIDTYGRWTSIKRLGYARQYIGCQDYELLLPIPEAALSKNVIQNPGYSK